MTRTRLSQMQPSSFDRLAHLWAALGRWDQELAQHGEDTAQLASRLAAVLGLAQPIPWALCWAGRLHDIGKVAVPRKLLEKQGPLSEEEQRVVRLHPGHSFTILQRTGISSEFLNTVLFHHERFDGSGYPIGLKREDIPFAARIVAVADVYCALTRRRPYRDRYSAEAAWALVVRNRARAFDPVIVDALEEVLKHDATSEG
ncbi:MAG: HD domain-containing protein [Chloroflexi bacterium]|nr:HD domain-containing protein [Chloroflexota bacterium]